MPNFILITIDSIRYDYFTGGNSHLTSQGITPYLDHWSRSAFHFNKAFSPGPSTGLTFPALLSGCYSSSFREKYGLSAKRKMLAEYMQEVGFTTCAFNSNPYLTSAFKYDRGFDYFYDDFVFQGTKKYHTLFKKVHLRCRALFKEPYWTVSSMNKDIVSWIEKHKYRPFFLWVHYMDVHGPYISKKGIKFLSRLNANMLWQKATRSPKTITARERQILKDTYIEEISYFDTKIKQLLEAIPDDTVVVITGDHGDFLGERGEYAHSGLLYNTLLHVPLLVKLPKDTHSARTIDEPVSTIDIVPTILDMNDIPYGEHVDGSSFYPLFLGKGKNNNDAPIISEEGSYHMSIIDYPWKLIANYKTSHFELYDLNDDPAEEHNLLSAKPEIFRTLNNHLEQHREKMNVRREGIDEVITPDMITKNEELIKRMRQLGYME